jgi:hypothetical protein
LERGVGAPSESMLMDAGWLAREVKVDLSQEKRSVYINLSEKKLSLGLPNKYKKTLGMIFQ